MASASNARTTALLIGLMGALVGYIGYSGSVLELLGIQGLQQQKERIVAIQDTVARLEAQTDSAKKELAKGTVEDVRRRLEEYRASLVMLRRLVPEQNEVPNLLDDMATRAKIRGVELTEVSPPAIVPGPAPFDTYRYGIKVAGRYDRIGEFLSDIASLQRIIVPGEVSLQPAAANVAKALGDTSGTLLQASFQIKTYVKSAQPAGGESES